jgi:hypothetical protein
MSYYRPCGLAALRPFVLYLRLIYTCMHLSSFPIAAASVPLMNASVPSTSPYRTEILTARQYYYYHYKLLLLQLVLIS